jgi:hypothetical protein
VVGDNSILWIVRGTSNILGKIYKKTAPRLGAPVLYYYFTRFIQKEKIMKKLTAEEALAKVQAFEKASGAVVESAPKKEDAEPKGIASDAFWMPAAKVVEAVEVAEVTPTPEAAAKSKKKEKSEG